MKITPAAKDIGQFPYTRGNVLGLEAELGRAVILCYIIALYSI